MLTLGFVPINFLRMSKNLVLWFLHPPQRKIIPSFNLTINGIHLKRYFCIKCLGVLIDSNLSSKPQVDSIVKKIKRSIGILSKLRYYVNTTILINLYCSLIYPFLTYDILSWGNA